MGIMDMFRGTSQQNQQNQQNQQAANPGDQTVPANPATTNQDGKMTGSDQTPPNPLDAYAKMWETSATTPEAPPAFSIDPNTLNSVTQNLDFTKDIPPELMQKATSGDMQAMMQMMNLVGRNAYKTSLSHTSALTDKFVDARSSFDKKNLGSSVKEELTNNALSQLPNANHPAVKTHLNMIARNIAQQNPDASPEQVAQAAAKYLIDITKALNPTANNGEASNNPSQSEEFDYFSYLTQSKPL